MTEITHDRFNFSDFRLTGGDVLPNVTLAYVTRGKLAPDGRNAILVTHGYTSGPRMIEPGVASSEGAWSTLVGLRRADQYGTAISSSVRTCWDQATAPPMPRGRSANPHAPTDRSSLTSRSLTSSPRRGACSSIWV